VVVVDGRKPPLVVDVLAGVVVVVVDVLAGVVVVVVMVAEASAPHKPKTMKSIDWLPR